MEKFQRAQSDTSPEKRERIIADTLATFPQHSRADVEAQLDDIANSDDVWLNDVYQVNITHRPDQSGLDIVWLSIKRRDKAAIHDWRDFQEIKNELVGPEYEGVELYPAESRLVDTANQYHLWVVKNLSFRFPFGFSVRTVSYESSRDARQRPKGGQ